MCFLRKYDCLPQKQFICLAFFHSHSPDPKQLRMLFADEPLLQIDTSWSQSSPTPLDNKLFTDHRGRVRVHVYDW